MPDSNTVTVAGGAAIVLALYATLLWRQAKARRVWRAGSTMNVTRISAYQMALMCGGAPRVALTGVVRLVGRKMLVPSVAGVLLTSEAAGGELDAIEREVLAAVRRRPAVFDVLLGRLVSALRRAGVTRSLRHELIAIGYMRSIGSTEWWKDYLYNMLPFAVPIGIAFGWCATAALPADAAYLARDFVGAAIATMLIAAWPTRVTALGRFIIWSATQHHPDFRTARATQGEALDAKTLGQAVALYGTEALAGSDMAWIPAVLAQRSETA